MANIADKVLQIRQAVVGKQIRETIASGIESINAEVVNTTQRQTNLEQTHNDAELIRTASENERKQSETSRKTAEQGRVSAEDSRTQAENLRKSAETLREQTFNQNETYRIETFTNNETDRQETFDTNETHRQQTFDQAETLRESQFIQIKKDYNTASNFNVVTYEEWVYTASQDTTEFTIDIGIFNPVLDIAELSQEGVLLSEGDNYTRLGAEITLLYTLEKGEKINIRVFKGVINEPPTADGSNLMGGSINRTKLSADIQDKIYKTVKAADFTEETVTVTNDIHPLVKGRLDTIDSEIVEVNAELDSHTSQLADIAPVNVKMFKCDDGQYVKGDGIHDDTTGIQRALDYANSLYGGDVTEVTGFIGWIEPEVIFPSGIYKCGQVTIPPIIKLKGVGKVVIKSSTGTANIPAGKFVDNEILNIYVEGITFLYFDNCFRTPTGNDDMCFFTFDKCFIAKTNVFIDMVGFLESKSTSFKMTRCIVSYGVKTLCKIYADKSHFEGNWFNHSVDSIFMELDSFATFKDNIWVPTNAGEHKAYIHYTASDTVRNLIFQGERFGGENGQCPIVIVGDVSADGVNPIYKNQGISFDNCYLASSSVYNPDGVAGVRACVILKPTISPERSIDFVSFKNCTFVPDLNGGIIQTYNTPNISSLLPPDFVIDFDYSSAISATKGVNKIAGEDLKMYVNTPVLSKNSYGYSKGSGKLKVADTSETGRKKANFKVKRNYPESYHAPIAYLLTLTGQGDSSFPAYAYGYSSTYILTISGEYVSSVNSKISYTKLHSSSGGVSTNADIISAHWGTGETGDVLLEMSGQNDYLDITIVFGSRMEIGNAYIQPLFDFSLLT